MVFVGNSPLIVFTSVVVGVVIGSVERHNLVKIKLTESLVGNSTPYPSLTIAYDQVKTRLSESDAGAEE